MADGSRDEQAKDRTDLAEDRTVLAHERSFASWVRTALACVGIGLAFHALFKQMQPTWAAKAIASVFLLAGIFILASAERRACTMLSRLEAHRVSALKPVKVRLLTVVLILATISLGAAMWLLIV